MKNIKSFDAFINEGFMEPIDRDIELNTDFDNKISLDEYSELLRSNYEQSFSNPELIKLNLFFGIWKTNRNNGGEYYFDKEIKGFGKPTKKLSGHIQKLTDKYKNSMYILHINITLKTSEQEGYDRIILKFYTLKEVFKFIDNI